MNSKTSTPHQHHHGKADYLGIAGSVLCLVHCLAMPALALGSTFTVSHGSSIGFLGLDYAFILVNGLAVYFATRAHRVPALRAFLWFSFALFSVSIVLEHQYHAFHLLGYLGSGLLIAGHFYNLIFCKPWRLMSQ